MAAVYLLGYGIVCLPRWENRRAWSTTKFSGAVPADEKRAMLDRVRKLQEAVKFAREEANNAEVKDAKTGKAILEFIFQTSAG